MVEHSNNMEILKTEKEKSKEKIVEGDKKKGWGAMGLEEKKMERRKGSQKEQTRGSLPPTHYLMVYRLRADKLSLGNTGCDSERAEGQSGYGTNQRCSWVWITGLIL